MKTITVAMIAGSILFGAAVVNGKSDPIAVHVTQGKDGAWTEREALRLCPVEGKRWKGEAVAYVAVAITKNCPGR